MNYHNQDLSELTRTAEHENNTLALAIADYESDDDDESELETLSNDVIEFFVDQIDEKLQAYIDDYYLNPESDYFDFLFDFAAENLETDAISQYMANNEIELDIEIVKDRLSCMLDYYCEVEITGNYAAAKGVSVTGAMIGEIEESMDLIIDMIPFKVGNTDTADEIWKGTLNGLSTVTAHDKSDCVYIDFSDTSANLVIKADMIDELFAAVED